MAIAAGVEEVLKAKFQTLFPHLDERQRRLALAAEARSLGHGGIAAVARAAGISTVTVAKGVAELRAPVMVWWRVWKFVDFRGF